MIPAQGAASDALRRVLDSVFAAPGYRWVERPDALAGVRRWFGALLAWFDALDERHPAVFLLLTIGMATVLVAVLVHVAWIFTRSLRASAARPHAPGGATPRRSEEWYRREADRLAALGYFVEAMQAEFLALVIALDAARVLRFHPSKTPAEYLAEIHLPADRRQEFRELVTSLYGFAFARWPCDAGAFSSWRAHALPERYAPAG